MPSVMRAVQITGYQRPFHYGHCPVPKPNKGEVLLRVAASGLCSTDIHLLEGRMDLGPLPRIPGHEIAGEVVDLGRDIHHWKLGHKVTVAIDVCCGKCMHCLTGNTQRCPNKKRIGFERDGGHADYIAVPEQNLVALPPSVSLEEAAILPDAVACMYHSLLTQGKLQAKQKVVILGAGGLGLHGIQIAGMAGAEVLATSRREERLKAIEEMGGIPLNPLERNLREAARELSGGTGIDLVADCIGTNQSIQEGLSILRPGGKLLVIGYLDEEFCIPSLDLLLGEKELIGCRGSTKRDLEQVVELVSKNKVKPLIGRTYSLAQIDRAAEDLKQGEIVGRVVLTR